MILENTWNISDNIVTYPRGESVNEAFFPEIADGCLVSAPLVNPHTPINAVPP